MSGVWFDIGVLAILIHGMLDLLVMSNCRYTPLIALSWISHIYGLDDSIPLYQYRSLLASWIKRAAFNIRSNICMTHSCNQSLNRTVERILKDSIRGSLGKASKYVQRYALKKAKSEESFGEPLVFWQVVHTVISAFLDRVVVTLLLQRMGADDDKYVVSKSIVMGGVLGAYEFICQVIADCYAGNTAVISSISSAWSALVSAIVNVGLRVSHEGRLLMSCDFNMEYLPIILHAALWLLSVTHCVVEQEIRTRLSVGIILITKIMLIIKDILKHHEKYNSNELDGSFVVSVAKICDTQKNKIVNLPTYVRSFLPSQLSLVG